MRRFPILVVLASSTLALAQPPGAESPPTELPLEPVAPEPVEVPVEPPAPPSAPPVAPPPITINVTNNNTGNNSNTNTQTTTAPVTVSTPVTTTVSTPVATTVSTPVTVAPSAPVIAAPGLVAPATSPRAIVGRYELFATKPPRWITLGILSDRGGHGPDGIRASIDLRARGAFRFGVAAKVERDGHRGAEKSAVAYVAWTRKLGRLDVRAQLGFGASSSGSSSHGRGESHEPGGPPRGDGDDGTAARTVGGEDAGGERGMDEPGRHGCAPRAEAALLVGLPLGKRLGLIAGPVVTATRPERGSMIDGEARHGAVDASFLGGLRWKF